MYVGWGGGVVVGGGWGGVVCGCVFCCGWVWWCGWLWWCLLVCDVWGVWVGFCGFWGVWEYVMGLKWVVLVWLGL